MRSRIIAGALALTFGSLLNVAAALATAPVPARVACPGCWHAALNTSWQWKLSEPPTAAEISSNTLGMWDIDGFDNTAATVTGLKARSKVVCYISAGSYEGWRSDASTFPGSATLNSKTANKAILGILGWKMAGWDERWPASLRALRT